MTSPNGTQAVDRAAQLLIQVARHRDPVTFTELTATSGLAKSTTSRLLTALERNGLVRREQAGRFRPGEVFVSYAWRGGAEADLVSVAQPVLDRLGEQTGETVNLGVPRDGGLVEQIAQVDSTYLIGGTNWVGMPCRCTAPRSARCCSRSARPSCRAAGWSSAPSAPSPAGPRSRRSWPPSASAVTRSPSRSWSRAWWRWRRRYSARRRGRRALSVSGRRAGCPRPAHRRRGQVHGGGACPVGCARPRAATRGCRVRVPALRRPGRRCRVTQDELLASSTTTP